MTLTDFSKYFQLWFTGHNCVLAAGEHVLILYLTEVKAVYYIIKDKYAALK